MTSVVFYFVVMFFSELYFVVFVLAISEVCSTSYISEENFDANLQVRTNNGIVQGIKEITENGILFYAYKGIPYAQPPVKNLRFHSPKPVRNWNGVLDATKSKSGCIEAKLRIIKKFFFVNGTENCLYLNIYSPKNPRSKGKQLPVMIFFYGGFFAEGNADLYQPDYLLEEDVIIVTFNYRVGIFGFLSTGDLLSPGNYGLKDQNLLMKWVKENINYFGGNKNKITISGQSAGAACAMYHMFSPKSKNLFNGVIAESGTALSVWSLQRNPRDIAFHVGTLMGIKTNSSKELISFLRKLDENELKNGQLLPILLNFGNIHQQGPAFAPVIEPLHKDAFITNSSYAIMNSGNFTKVPVIIGFNSEEYNLFYRYLNITIAFTFLFDISPGYMKPINTSPRIRRIVGNKIKRHYFKSGSFVSATEDELSHFFADDLFVRPTIKTIQLFSKHFPVYFYNFSYEGSLGLSGIMKIYPKRIRKGAAHNEELWYIWNKKVIDRSNKKDQFVSRRLIKLWTNFVKTGNPTPTKEDILYKVSWPAVNSTDDIKYLDIGSNLTVKSFNMDDMFFWEQLYKNHCRVAIDTY